MPGIFSQRHVQRDKISDCRGFCHFREEFHLKSTGPAGGEVRIVGNNAHTKGDCPAGKLGANAPHAQYGKRLLVQFHPLVVFSAPSAVFHGGMGLGNVAREGCHHAEGKLRGGNGIAGRGIDHNDAVLCCSRHVNIINPNTCPADNFQFFGNLKDFCRDLGL